METPEIGKLVIRRGNRSGKCGLFQWRVKSLEEAAMEFCFQDGVIRQLKSEVARCLFANCDDPPVSEEPPCDPQAKPDDQCENCKRRYASNGAYQFALRRRQAAKKSMLMAYRRLLKGKSEVRSEAAR